MSGDDVRVTDRVCVFMLAVLVYAPALGARFDFPSLPVYAGTAGLFLFFTAVRNLVTPEGFASRVGFALPFALLWATVALAFLKGGGAELRIMAVFTLNCALGPMVVLYPWNPRSLRWFAGSCVALSLVLTYVTVTRFGSDDVIREIGLGEISGYLNVTMMIGVGCLCMQYFVFRRMSWHGLAILGLLWVGLALGQGRGPFVSVAMVALIYSLVYFLGMTGAAVSVRHKLIYLVAACAAAPLVWSTLNSLERNARRFGSLFSDVNVAFEDSGRSYLFARATELIAEAPVLGHGLGSYQMRGGHPHNLFLQYGIDGGYVAMVMLGVFLATIVLLFAIGVLRAGIDRSLGMLYLGVFGLVVVNMLKSYDAYEARTFFVFAAFVLVAAGMWCRQSGERRSGTGHPEPSPER